MLSLRTMGWGLVRWKNCRRAVVVAVGVIWKFRLTFRPGNYIWSFSYGFGVLVRDLGEWRPGFYTEFRYKSYEHSGLAWGAIFKKCMFWSYFQDYHVHFSRNKFPNWIFPHALNSPDPAARPPVRPARPPGTQNISPGTQNISSDTQNISPDTQNISSDTPNQ